MASSIRVALAVSLAACTSQQPSATEVNATEEPAETTAANSTTAASTPDASGLSELGTSALSGGASDAAAPGVTIETPVGSEPHPLSETTSADPDVVTSSDARAPDTTTDTASENGGISSSDPSFPDGPPTETDVAAVPTVRQEHAVVALDDDVYVLGGFTPSATSTVQAYSPSTNTWRDVADFPVVFHHPNAAAVDGKLYVAGFLLGSSLSDGDGRVFAYDPAENEWTQRTSMPSGTERGSACVAALGSKLYVFGGASNTTLPDASAYDTVADEWQELTFMPKLREHCVAAAVGDLIYIVSGRAGSIGGVGAESFVYDPATDAYDERAPIPTPRGGTAGALLHGRLFVFGGEGNPDAESGVFPEIEAYDPATDTWHSYPAMTSPRHGYGAAAVADAIYLPGGGSSQGFGAVDTHTVFKFEP